MRSLNLMASVALAGCLLLTGCNRDLKDPGEQYAIDIAAIDNYLAGRGLTAYIDVTGIRYTVTTVGTDGLPPRHDQEVKVQYKGMLLDGTVFDEGTTEGPLAQYILGWQRGLELLPNGTVATIYLPSELGYGTKAKATIPPNSVLIFDVVVEDVILTPAQKVRLPADINSIDAHLANNNITAVEDTTGVRYVITQQGTGELPGWYTKVKFNYTGKLLDGTEFVTGTAEPTGATNSRVIDYIHGIAIALSRLQVGGKGTFYIPSGLAFGANENSSAPVAPHTNVIYEVELVGTVPE